MLERTVLELQGLNPTYKPKEFLIERLRADVLTVDDLRWLCPPIITGDLATVDPIW